MLQSCRWCPFPREIDPPLTPPSRSLPCTQLSALEQPRPRLCIAMPPWCRGGLDLAVYFLMNWHVHVRAHRRCEVTEVQTS
jgi:hypothetical protein